MPFVSKREDDEARKAEFESRARLPSYQLRLMGLAFTNRIHSRLAQHQRPIVGRRKQMGKVAPIINLAMEIDVEANHIEEIEIEIFRRRVIRKRKEAVRIAIPADLVKFAQELIDRARPVPAHDIRSNLVADAIGENHVAELTHRAYA